MKLNNKLYDVLKWLGLIFFPALAVLLATVLPVWGVLIGVSQATIGRAESLEEFYETETEEDIKDEETEGV